MPVSEITGKIDVLIKSAKLLSRLQRNHAVYYQMIADYYTRLANARKNGDFVVAHTMFFPVEILHAMNLVPMHLEFTGYMMSLFSVSCDDVLKRAGEMGFAPEICSGHRLIVGALDLGILPPADAVICANLVCDNAIKSGELTMEFNHCPGFLFDYPFHQGEAEQQYIMRELKDIISFLEQVSGHRMDWGLLSQSVAEMNKQIALVHHINELCKSVPSPFMPQHFLKFLALDYMFTGIPQVTQYLEAMRDELSQMVAEGKGFANPERLRLIGLMIPPWHLQGDIDRVLQEHGAALVCYPNLCSWPAEKLDPATPLESVAKRLSMCPPLRMFGPLDERAINPVIEAVRENKVDGAINFAHLGCRQMGATIKIFKDVLDELGVPMLNIDCDLVDSTVTSEEEVNKQLEQFFELLEDR